MNSRVYKPCYAYQLLSDLQKAGYIRLDGTDDESSTSSSLNRHSGTQS
jgi:hypothetical protein